MDIGAPKGTPIHAAAAGVVVKVACNASLAGQPYSCDADGSPSVAGCGYYSEVRTGQYIHRYCHQLIKPYLTVGQQVAAGQVIGIVGSSGHSSGPHLHWEIHDVTNGRAATSENALDPEVFLRSVGVPVPVHGDGSSAVHPTTLSSTVESVPRMKHTVAHSNVAE